ncbi:MAG: hypothetical protein WA152_00480 [Microgenomates group bacterium]
MKKISKKFKNKSIFVVFTIILSVLLFWFTYNYVAYSRFDSEVWKREPMVSGNISKKTRSSMVDNLLDKYDLVGMDKGEIDSLLGKPEDANYFKEYDYVYYLGREGGFANIDSQWLVIKFKDDFVSEVKVVQD